MDTTQILYLAGAFLLGFIIAWFAGRGGPTRAAEEAVAETDAVRRKLSSAESDLRKTQGQVKENLASLDQLAADKDNLVKMLRTSEQGLSDAGAEIDRLTLALNEAHDARLLQETELAQARGALTDARSQVASLTTRLDAAAEIALEASQVAEIAILAEQAESDEAAVRMAELESQLALARATAERLAEKEALVAAEVLLRRREYRDILTGGEDGMVAALATRDQALANAQTQLDYMRRDLSMLTSAGAQLAVTLEQRNGEYDNLLNRLVAKDSAVRALPEVSLAAAAAPAADRLAGEPVVSAVAEAGPDLQAELAARAAELDEIKQEYENLRAALEQAIADRNDLQGQLDTRLGAIEELNGKVAEGQSALETLGAEKAGLLNRLSARAAVMSTVLAKIGGFDEELRGLAATVAQAANHDSAAQQEPAATTQQEEGETHAS
jgi:chromosome segregation ATPase